MNRGVVANDSLWCTEAWCIDWWWVPTIDCDASRGGASRGVCQRLIEVERPAAASSGALGGDGCHPLTFGTSRGGASRGGCQRLTVSQRGVAASDSLQCTEVWCVEGRLPTIHFVDIFRFIKIFNVFIFYLLSGLLSRGGASRGCQRFVVVHRGFVH